MMHLVHRGKDAALKALLAKQMGPYILVTDSSPRSSVLLMHIRVTAVPLIVPFHHLPVLFAVRWRLILRPRLMVMTLLAKSLPVGLVPEEFLVTSVRNDMIHDRCGNGPSCFQTLFTQRMDL